MNGWNVLNLGQSGITITPRHGADLGVLAGPADLISVLIGTNDQHVCAVGALFGAFLDQLLDQNAHARVVVVTPLLRNDEGASNATVPLFPRCATVEEHREQMRAAVRTRQATAGGRLHLIEGKVLLPVEQLIDGVHPRDGSAMSQVARRLNAELHRLGLATRFRCYAQQNTDLRLAFCQDGDLARCDFAALMEHWERAGRHEGRRTDCQPGVEAVSRQGLR